MVCSSRKGKAAQRSVCENHLHIDSNNLSPLTSKFIIKAAKIPKKSSVVADDGFSPKNFTVSRNSFFDFSCKLSRSFSSPSVSSIMFWKFQQNSFNFKISTKAFTGSTQS